MEGEILNKVEQSGLVNINLEELYVPGKRMVFDLASRLEEGLVLREKAFREKLKKEDWSVFENALVSVFCSTEAIVPTWAFMLVTVYLSKAGARPYFISPENLEDAIFRETLQNFDPEKYRNQKVLVHGCSKVEVPAFVFVEVTRLLRPVVQSVFYGEACSAVPLYKRDRG